MQKNFYVLSLFPTPAAGETLLFESIKNMLDFSGNMC